MSESNRSNYRVHSVVQQVHTILSSGEIKYVSLDFFDTLVVRRCETPADLFIELGRRLHEAGIRLPLGNAAEFRGLRREAERLARAEARDAGREGEVHLNEIYARLLPEPAQIEKAVGLELKTEQDFLTFCPQAGELLRLARENKLPIIITSDIYLSRPQLAILLAAINEKLPIHERITPERIFTSADAGTSKHHDLFPHVLESLGIAASGLLHIGDNYNADVVRPGQLGVRVGYFRRYRPAQERILRMEARRRRKTPSTDDYLRAARSLADLRGADSPAHSYGAFVLGPVFAGYIFYLIHLMRTREAARLLFLAREGAFLRELFDIAVAHSGEDSKGKLLHVSRVSTFRCTLETIDRKFLANLHSEGRPFTAQEAFEFLLPENTPPTELRRLSNRAVNHGDTAAALLNVLEQTGSLAEAHKYAVEQRRMLVEIINELVSPKDRSIILADVGWQGRIQTQIAHVLNAEKTGHDVLGAYMMLGGGYRDFALRNKIEMASFLPASPLSEAFRESIYRAPLLLELAAMPNFGTTLRYRRVGGRAEPVHANLAEDTIPPEIRGVQQGIKDFLTQYLEIADGNPQTPGFLNRFAKQCEEILARAILRPETHELQLWADVRQEENFGRPSRKRLVDRKRGYRYSGMAFKEIRNHPSILWPAAMVRSMDPTRASAYEEFEYTNLEEYTRVRTRGSLRGFFIFVGRVLFGISLRERILNSLPVLAKRLPVVKRFSPKLKAAILRVISAGASRS